MIGKIQSVVRRVFDDDGIVVAPGMKFEAMDGYDSIRHLEMFMGIEREFGISFDIDRIGAIDDFAGLIAEIEELASGR